MGMLQDPIVPTPDTSSLQYVTKGLASMIAQRQYAQQLELANQKMAQDAAIKDEGFKFAREKLAQELPLQNAQIAHLNAEANAQNAKAKQDNTDKTNGYAALESYMKLRPTFNFGTDDGEAAILQAQSDFGDALYTSKGVQIFKEDAIRQRFKSRANAQFDDSMTKQYEGMLKKKGIGDPGIMNTLDYDSETGSVKPNQYWGLDKTTKQPYTVWDSTTGRPVPIDQAEALDEKVQAQKGWFRAGFTASELKQVMGLKQRVDNRRSFAAPPAKDQINVAAGSVADEVQNSQDQQALAWAKNNPDDPRAAQIIKKLGIQQ